MKRQQQVASLERVLILHRPECDQWDIFDLDSDSPQYLYSKDSVCLLDSRKVSLNCWEGFLFDLSRSPVHPTIDRSHIPDSGDIYFTTIPNRVKIL